MARPGGLGKGLGALIPTEATGITGSDGADGPRLADVPIGSVVPNPHQPRMHFDEETLTELAASIREIGVLQPILVRPGDGGTFELIAGERRWRAAMRAGLDVIPAIVRATDDLGSMERALVENLHRQDLTPLEEAAAYQQLIEDFQLTHEQVASRVGKSRSAVTNTLRLLSLPPAIQHLLADGRLSAGHARALLGTPDRAMQEALARQAASEHWSVRALEDAVRLGGAGGEPEGADEAPAVGRAPTSTHDGAGLTPATRLRPPGLLELEGLLADYLSTRVTVAMSANRGKLTVEFADLEDLERLYYLITSTGTISDDHSA
jgi:ParB family transcriptional regulator, chromosome partitioning protein